MKPGPGATLRCASYPIVEHHLGDMRTVRLGQKFQAVVILDAVSYLLSEADIHATLQTAAAHLRPGGVLVMAPDWFRETFRDHFVSNTTRCRGDTVLTCIEYVHDPSPADTTIETVMFLLIREKGQLRIEQDRHTMGLFGKTTWFRLMAEAGFEAETRPYVEVDCGARLTLLVGVLQAEPLKR